LIDNPNSIEYLKRDIKNVCLFFRKHGLKVDEEAVLKKIVKK
jgi:serine/threonine-protein kinase RIO1